MNPHFVAPFGRTIMTPLLLAGLGSILSLPKTDAEEPHKTPAITELQQKRLQEARSLGEQAEKFRTEGKLDKAISATLKRLEIERGVPGPTHEGVLNALEQLATLCIEADDFAKARAARQEILALRIKLRGERHFSVVDARLDLADVDLLAHLTAEQRRSLGQTDALMDEVIRLHGQAKFREALPLARRVVDMRRKLLGQSHPDTASALNNLGELLSGMGEYAEAWSCTQEALAANEKTLGKNHPDTAVRLNNLGGLLARQGNLAAARPYLEQSLSILRNTRGEDDPDVARMLNNLGSLLQFQGDYAAARPYFEHALGIQKRASGENHQDSVPMLNNLGMLFIHQKEYALARPYLEQALEIRKKTLGESHADTGRSFYNLAGLLWLQGKEAAAQPYFEQALEIERKALGENHPNTAMMLDNLGGLLYSQGKYAAAMPYLEKGLAIRQKVLGENHADTAHSLTSVGFSRFTERDYQSARTYLERALAAHLALDQSLLGTLSEAEALAYVEMARSDRDPILSVLRQLPNTKPEEAYAPIWTTRGAASRALATRRNLALTIPEAKDLAHALNCKAHDLNNLYVVDGSFFVSSGAVNPALTIMANALRVGDHLLERLR